MRTRTRLVAAVAAGILVLAACGDDADPTDSGASGTAATVAADQADGLAVGPVSDELRSLGETVTQQVTVFGVPIVATSTTPEDKVLHAATVMAQYLDNDADGAPDDPAVIDALIENRATLVMAATADELASAISFDALDGRGAQDLYGDETAPEGGFDAALEEVHHLILNYGWAQVHPGQLAQREGSVVAEAMDLARGGRFDEVPAQYPEGAWYTYDDETCDYTCMITEYVYWAHTSLLGAQAERAGEIGDEWRLATPDQVRTEDPAVTAVLEDPALGLPTVLPDGDYQGAP